MAAADGISGAIQPAMAGTSGRAAMNTPFQSPFDPLLPLLATAQRIPRTAWGSIARLDVVFDTGDKIPLRVDVVLDARPVRSDPADFDPTPLQVKILRHLAEGPKSPKQIRERTNGRMYDPRGIMELCEVGLVEKRAAKFQLTEPVGESFAAGLTEDDEE